MLKEVKDDQGNIKLLAEIKTTVPWLNTKKKPRQATIHKI